jgi:hypothetical protein
MKPCVKKAATKHFAIGTVKIRNTKRRETFNSTICTWTSEGDNKKKKKKKGKFGR